jgi:ubiquinone/menaquinone biosynthesis C-methylase UbiE
MQLASNEYQWTGNRNPITGSLYMLPNPNNDQELDRLDLQHYMLRYVLKGNYLAPIAKPSRILDIGCGTGRWSIEMAQEFPQAELIGVDLKLPEVDTELLLANCHFQVGNVLKGLPFEDAAFDFVHQRLLLFAVPLVGWSQLVNELVRVTRRGGWVELTEVSPFFQHCGPATEKLLDLIVRTAQQRGLDMSISQHIGSLLTNAGLKRVGTGTQLVPLGNWGGELGKMAITDILAIAQGMKPLVTAVIQTTPEEYDTLAMQMEQEVEQYHTTFTFHLAYGQR